MSTYITGMVYETCSVAVHSGVDYKSIVYTEHVTADTARVIILLSLVTKLRPNNLTGILDHLTIHTKSLLSCRTRHTIYRVILNTYIIFRYILNTYVINNYVNLYYINF